VILHWSWTLERGYDATKESWPRLLLVLTAMLMTDMKEKQNNEMHMTGYDLEKVVNFLKYIYAKDSEAPKVKIKKSKVTLTFEKELHGKDNGNTLSPTLMRLAHHYQVQGLLNLCEYKLKSTKPSDKTLWTAKDIRTLGYDLDNQVLKECSEIWLAADCFQTLTCGGCNFKTQNSVVKLTCAGRFCHSGDPIVSGAQAITERGNELSSVTVKLPLKK